MATKYGPRAKQKVKKVMHEFKHGTLKSGTSGKKVMDHKQAVAIGLSEARRSGAKVPTARFTLPSRHELLDFDILVQRLFANK